MNVRPHAPRPGDPASLVDAAAEAGGALDPDVDTANRANRARSAAADAVDGPLPSVAPENWHA